MAYRNSPMNDDTLDTPTDRPAPVVLPGPRRYSARRALDLLDWRSDDADLPASLPDRCAPEDP